MNVISRINKLSSVSRNNVNILYCYLIYILSTTEPVLGRTIKRDARVDMDAPVYMDNNVAKDKWTYNFPRDLSEPCHNHLGITDYCDIRSQKCDHGFCSENCFSICNEPYISENGQRACDINCKSYKVSKHYEEKLRAMKATMDNITPIDHDLQYRTSHHYNFVVTRATGLALMAVFGIISMLLIISCSLLISMSYKNKKCKKCPHSNTEDTQPILSETNVCQHSITEETQPLPSETNVCQHSITDETQPILSEPNVCQHCKTEETQPILSETNVCQHSITEETPPILSEINEGAHFQTSESQPISDNSVCPDSNIDNTCRLSYTRKELNELRKDPI